MAPHTLRPHGDCPDQIGWFMSDVAFLQFERTFTMKQIILLMLTELLIYHYIAAIT